ncbi:hypothetical protein GGE16_002779 [Rhizobium leguminosarum]|uniref:Uncharacterized protein n=1 Tax=Rhizobium leguminosarum TaxID=384 RepID=A0AAE2MK17_RHILE|nr:hypothetical protein [Rhizobium leguminosarum]MBB4431902.1 hypothetical protein [Rhizobium esperanzae]MBB4415131.1 hypothetical protein [Rhizobium leguminosarum]MBB4528515.1 hypothetical protein [Rhizobium leguminosarum]MBB4539482.1 hypothetical protein [Rhizobium leguminosarum]
MPICGGNAITRFAAGRFFAVPAFSLAGNARKPLYFQHSPAFPNLHRRIHKMLWLAIN